MAIVCKFGLPSYRKENKSFICPWSPDEVPVTVWSAKQTNQNTKGNQQPDTLEPKCRGMHDKKDLNIPWAQVSLV